MERFDILYTFPSSFHESIGCQSDSVFFLIIVFFFLQACATSLSFVCLCICGFFFFFFLYVAVPDSDVVVVLALFSSFNSLFFFFGLICGEFSL